MRIFHDNSGKSPSWYLKHIIIRDMKTNEKFFFINENWLSNEKGNENDQKIDRIIPACGPEQKSKFKYLLKNKTVHNISDNHLWYSIFARPINSSFTRLDRLTCCFVLLNMSMLLNILYYDQDNSSSPDALKIGPFNITPEQV